MLKHLHNLGVQPVDLAHTTTYNIHALPYTGICDTCVIILFLCSEEKLLTESQPQAAHDMLCAARTTAAGAAKGTEHKQNAIKYNQPVMPGTMRVWP